jgi:mannosyltransferase OCH1-like enzyme
MLSSTANYNSRQRFFNIKDLVVGVILCLTMVHNFYNFYTFQFSSVIKSKSEPSFLPPTVVAQQQQQLPTPPQEAVTIPLRILTNTNQTYECSKNLVYLPDRILPKLNERKIPRMVHLTSKSRCLTQPFIDNLRTWHFDDHSVYFHDDAAVERLLTKFWPSFPHIPVAVKCLRSGAAKADLWRYLVLWEYGGIYTDIDNAPGKFWNASTIALDDDAFFVVEKLGVLSQFFLAASPKHPLLYLAVHQTLHRLLNIDHVGKQFIPQVTGPGALKVAFKYFMRTQETTHYGRVRAGKYYGVGGRSVTVAGSKETSWQLVKRGSVPEQMDGYKQMHMRHFSAIAKKKFNESCLVHLYNIEYPGSEMNMTNW